MKVIEAPNVNHAYREGIDYLNEHGVPRSVRGGRTVLVAPTPVTTVYTKPWQRVLFDRFANILRPDGHMFLGHSESLYKVTDRFTLLGKTIHQRAA